MLCLYFCFVLSSREAHGHRDETRLNEDTLGGLSVRISVLRRVRELRVVHA